MPGIGGSRVIPASPSGGGSSKWGQTSTAKFSGSGSPVGVVTPSGEGDLYVDDTTPALWQATGATSADWQQVGTSGQIAAGQTGVTTTDKTLSDGGVTVTNVFVAGKAALAIMVVGDTWPRWVIMADATDGLYAGDGTFDPTAGSGLNLTTTGLFGPAGGSFSLSGDTTVQVSSGAGDALLASTSGTASLSGGSNNITVNSAGAGPTCDFTYPDNAHGPVLVDQSDGHTYRIISTAGVLSTVQVS